jgi:dsRNA-specific ribonuclease
VFRAECALTELDLRREGEAGSRRAAEQLAAEAVLQVIAPEA